MTNKLSAAILSLLIAGLPGFLVAAEAEVESTQQSSDAAQAEDDNAEAEAEIAATQSDDEVDTEDDEDSPSRFIPTEQISQDLGVSFPVDI